MRMTSQFTYMYIDAYLLSYVLRNLLLFRYELRNDLCADILIMLVLANVLIHYP